MVAVAAVVDAVEAAVASRSLRANAGVVSAGNEAPGARPDNAQSTCQRQS